MSGTAPIDPAAGGDPAQAGTLLGGTPAGTPAGTAPPTGEAAPPADARDWLPEAFRANPVFKDIGTVEALAKSYDGAARLVGLDKGQVLRIPAADDEAGQAEMFARLGRPEKPEGYEFPELPGALVEGVEPAARTAFHKLGLSAAQARGVMELYGGQVTAAETAKLARADEVHAAVRADLEREWGAAFQDRLHAANRVIAEVGGEALDKLVKETRMPDGTLMGNHPVLIKFLAEIGQKLAEPGSLQGGSGGAGGNGPMTPAEAQAALAEMKADPAFLREFGDRSHANYSTHKAKWDALHRAAFPEPAG